MRRRPQTANTSQWVLYPPLPLHIFLSIWFPHRPRKLQRAARIRLDRVELRPHERRYPGRLLRARRADTPCPPHLPHCTWCCSTTTPDCGQPLTRGTFVHVHVPSACANCGRVYWYYGFIAIGTPPVDVPLTAHTVSAHPRHSGDVDEDGAKIGVFRRRVAPLFEVRGVLAI